MSVVGGESSNKMKRGKGACRKWRKMMGTGKNQHRRTRTRHGKGTTPPVAKQIQSAPQAYILLPCEYPMNQWFLKHFTHFPLDYGSEKHSMSRDGSVFCYHSSCFSMRAGSLRSSIPLHSGLPSHHFYWDLTFLADMWTYPSLFALPLYLSFVPCRRNWDVQRASWIEELRTGILHSSLLSEKKEDDKILPEMNGVILIFQSCCFKLHICLKLCLSLSCILAQFSRSDFDEYIISHPSEKSSV